MGKTANDVIKAQDAHLREVVDRVAIRRTNPP